VQDAPTVEQCRADQKLWSSKMEPNDAGVNNVTIDELANWKREMFGCMNTYPESLRLYAFTIDQVTLVQYKRVSSFLVRHNLVGQFIAEDAQGTR
jgi:hypothetical protein